MKYSSLELSQQDESNGSKIAFLELILDEKLNSSCRDDSNKFRSRACKWRPISAWNLDLKRFRPGTWIWRDFNLEFVNGDRYFSLELGYGKVSALEFLNLTSSGY
ncbi:hypothetical protein RhiirC2_770842 [Rhizophagus irregularis]|uniref:Uncharacterized protein n=1 Tax=Rhizophagus irregularis TaxID=588596 RepID=A0A2N1NVD5_9GLOM|nr:hypothetical protein RhiirC2_770842 [Rhizophagus irregularis]